MDRILIMGNSGSGKTTLAGKLASQHKLAHLDLDSVAWQAGKPERLALTDSKREVDLFTAQNQGWVIEGCYTDLLELVAIESSKLIYLNLSIEDCINNAKLRPWEPHKYASKAAQDANLEMLIDWIRAYESRDDTFSKAAHQSLFDRYIGDKQMITQNA